MSPFITCTGIDDNTDLDAADRMATPGVEFGILLTNDPEGRNRYPNKATIKSATEILGNRCAVHVCGKTARADMLAGRYDETLSRVGRIQVNGAVSIFELDQIGRRFPDQQIITQHTEANRDLRWSRARLADLGANHALLVDGSGGRGISPENWPLVSTDKRVGFAGGLGPDNLATELLRIKEVSGGHWWVDMESKLRDATDWLSLDKCSQVIAIAKALVPRRFLVMP